MRNVLTLSARSRRPKLELSGKSDLTMFLRATPPRRQNLAPLDIGFKLSRELPRWLLELE